MSGAGRQAVCVHDLLGRRVGRGRGGSPAARHLSGGTARGDVRTSPGRLRDRRGPDRHRRPRLRACSGSSSGLRTPCARPATSSPFAPIRWPNCRCTAGGSTSKGRTAGARDARGRDLRRGLDAGRRGRVGQASLRTADRALPGRGGVLSPGTRDAEPVRQARGRRARHLGGAAGVHRRHEQVSSLLSLAHAVAEAGTSEEVAERLVVVVPEVVDCDRAGVWLWDDLEQNLRSLRVVGRHSRAGGLPAGHGHLGRRHSTSARDDRDAPT